MFLSSLYRLSEAKGVIKNMKDFGTVFIFYLSKQLRGKAFLFVTLFLCVASVASLIIMNNIFSNSPKTTLYVVNHTKQLSGIWDNDAYKKGTIGNLTLNFSMLDSKKSKSELIKVAKDESISIAAFDEENGKISMDVIDTGKISLTDISLLQSLTKQIIQTNKIAELGISKEILAKINPTIDIQLTNPSVDVGKYGIVLVLFLLMVVFIILYSNSASNEIAYLKTNRIMEIFSTSVKPLPLYLGVNFAYCLIPLMQLIATIICVYVTKNVANIGFDKISSSVGISLNTLQFDTLLVYMVLFLLGFFVYSFINTAMVSIVSKAEDITAISVPIAFVGLSQYFIGVMATSDDSLFPKICSYIPLTSPSVMFLRYAFGFVGIGQMLISVLILLVTVSLLAVLGAQLFTRGISFYGNIKEFSFKLNKTKIG